ncbi:uncharacterized protein [Nerophis lumbriciformis]|uniref:uncharacterized protein isoform X1 n=1 Tax=Nerophis lumbriciformis TaxID=546530 RepID=UPI003BAC3112
MLTNKVTIPATGRLAAPRNTLQHQATTTDAGTRPNRPQPRRAPGRDGQRDPGAPDTQFGCSSLRRRPPSDRQAQSVPPEIYIHTYIHIYIHIHTYTYTYPHIHIYTYTYTYVHIHIYKHTYIHTHIHTYTQFVSPDSHHARALPSVTTSATPLHQTQQPRAPTPQTNGNRNSSRNNPRQPAPANQIKAIKKKLRPATTRHQGHGDQPAPARRSARTPTRKQETPTTPPTKRPPTPTQTRTNTPPPKQPRHSIQTRHGGCAATTPSHQQRPHSARSGHTGTDPIQQEVRPARRHTQINNKIKKIKNKKIK